MTPAIENRVEASDFIGPCCKVYDPIGEHAFLSNYAATPIVDDGSTWPTAEHLYQAAKFDDANVRSLICAAPSPEMAKAIAWDARNAHLLLDDWDDRREQVMRRVLKLKFEQCRAAATALAYTWPQPIIESSPEDAFWGAGPSGDGQNVLGQLLEAQRERLVGRPALLKLARLPPGEGGASMSGAFLMRWIGNTVIERLTTRLAYDAFQRIDIYKTLGTTRDASSLMHERHARLLDEKYAGYVWTSDARSVIPNWGICLRGLLTDRLPSGARSAKVIAVGAGSANEAENVWSAFGANVTLVDWGIELAKNCQRGAPKANTLRRRAEDLRGVPSQSQDAYVSLRSYDSACIDVPAALAEAARVLRAEGMLMISISDGYLTAEGEVVRGQICSNGEIDRSTPWRKLLEVVDQTLKIGFSAVRFFDLQTEIGFSAKRLRV
jgi:ribA/ribD-fused uncharacterized protein